MNIFSKSLPEVSPFYFDINLLEYQCKLVGLTIYIELSKTNKQTNKQKQQQKQNKTWCDVVWI